MSELGKLCPLAMRGARESAVEENEKEEHGAPHFQYTVYFITTLYPPAFSGVPALTSPVELWITVGSCQLF